MRFIGGWICSGLLMVAFALQSEARAAAKSDANCVPQAEMQVIAKDFKQFANLGSSEYCYDGSTTSGLIEALEFMRNTPFAQKMDRSGDELFSGTFAGDWYAYFTQRIDSLEVQANCAKGVGAFVYVFSNTMYVCPLLLSDSFSSIDRISVMMHEARHKDGFPHIMCTAGARAGLKGACDNKIADMGSYAVTVETYAQLGAYATDLHPALKAYARANAAIYAAEAFQTPARVDYTPNFLLTATDKQLYKLPADGTVAVESLGAVPALGHIVKRSRLMILFPEDKTWPAKYVFAGVQGTIDQDAGDLAAEYNSQSPAQRADLVDMHIGAQWTARVYKTHAIFACDPTSSATQDVPFNGTNPSSLIYPGGYDRASANALLATTTGEILEIGCASRQAYVRASSVALDQKYKRVYKAGGEVLGLRSDGRLFKVDGKTSQALQTQVDGRIDELVPSESYSFFDRADTGT